MKRLVTVIATLFLLLLVSAMADFWASTQANKHHCPSCQSVEEIKPSSLIVFKIPQEALKAGGVPFKACKPLGPGYAHSFVCLR